MVAPRKKIARGRLKLRLYVAGHAPNSLRAIGNAKAICEEYFQGRYELEIIDMISHSKRAAADGIIVDVAGDHIPGLHRVATGLRSPALVPGRYVAFVQGKGWREGE